MDHGVNIPHARILIKVFEARKVAEAQAMAHAKANKSAWRRTTTSKKLPLLIEDNDIEVDDELVTRRDIEPTNPLDVPRHVAGENVMSGTLFSAMNAWTRIRLARNHSATLPNAIQRVVIFG